MDAKLMLICILGVCLIALVIASPFFTIWSLNYLFHTEIPIDFKSWCAVIWLLSVFHGIRIGAQNSG